MTILEKIYNKTCSNETLVNSDILGDKDYYRFSWKKGLAIQQIIQFEKENNIHIPDEYKRFLQMSNGADLFIVDDDYSSYHLLSLEEMFEETVSMKECGYDIRDNLAFFQMEQSDDFLMIDPEGEMITYCLAEYDSSEWVRMHTGFNNFMLRLFWANGHPFWEWLL